MLLSVLIILLCQLIGEIISHGLSLPIPGPVLGMLFLVVILALKERFGPVSHGPDRYAIEQTGGVLIKNLSLLFVPAGVGIIDKLDILSKHGIALLVAILTSTILGIAVSALAFTATARLTHNVEDAE